MSKRIALAIALACAVALVAGCAGNASTSGTGGAKPEPATSQVATEPVEEQSSTGPGKVGDEKTAGPWTVSVQSVTPEQQAPGQVAPAAGKEFMFVSVSLANTGTGTLEIKPEDFSMTDASGAPVQPFGKRQAYNAVGMTPLPANAGTTTTFIYEVAPGSKGYTFTYAPTVDGAKQALVWTVP